MSDVVDAYEIQLINIRQRDIRGRRRAGDRGKRGDQLPIFSIIVTIGMNMATTMVPTITASTTIISGSISEVSALTALSTSSS